MHSFSQYMYNKVSFYLEKYINLHFSSTDDNECKRNVCNLTESGNSAHGHQRCINTVGSYYCVTFGVVEGRKCSLARTYSCLLLNNYKNAPKVLNIFLHALKI